MCHTHTQSRVLTVVLTCEHDVLLDLRCQECGHNKLICQHKATLIPKRRVAPRGKKKKAKNGQRRNYKCVHKKNKYTCVPCGGGSVCEHGIQRATCKDCSPQHRCIHDRIKYKCVECKGSSVCDHNILRTLCAECGGGSLCEHNKTKSHCTKCSTCLRCIHGKIKSVCVECHGSQICIHNIKKIYCNTCDGRLLCKTVDCETHGNKKYGGFCVFCFISNSENFDSPLVRNHKPKEIATADSITEMFPDFTWILDKRVKDGCSRRRPDLLLDMATHLIIIEIDEKRHGGYSCEHKRMMELLQDCSVPIEGEAISIPVEGEEDVQITTLARPIVFIRFNPDGYTTSDGVQVKSPWTLKSNGLVTIREGSNTEWYKRLDTLNDQIAYWVENCPEKTVEVVHLFY